MCPELPKGPKRQKRPGDVISNAVKVMRIATGEETETLTGDGGKDAVALSLGRPKSYKTREVQISN